jgi:endonuclease YncB( thermonuclease family)
LGNLEDFARWRRRQQFRRANSHGPRRRRWFLPTPMEFVLSSAVAAIVVVVWLQWNSAERTATAVAASTAVGDIVGRASVIDGDTIDIHGERIRILDIDAPESGQSCTKPGGEEWRCGQKAALALSNWIGSQTVACATTGKDIYDRWLARCTVGSANMGEWLAVNGWVVPYRDCHCEVIREAAARAKAAGVGIWSSEFQMPWEWRATEKAQTEPQPDAQGRCVIKGNISKSGERIYHVPGNRYYDKTIVDERSGERWFCSESEAIAAGWRPAKV